MESCGFKWMRCCILVGVISSAITVENDWRIETVSCSVLVNSRHLACFLVEKLLLLKLTIVLDTYVLLSWFSMAWYRSDSLWGLTASSRLNKTSQLASFECWILNHLRNLNVALWNHTQKWTNPRKNSPASGLWTGNWMLAQPAARLSWDSAAAELYPGPAGRAGPCCRCPRKAPWWEQRCGPAAQGEQPHGWDGAQQHRRRAERPWLGRDHTAVHRPRQDTNSSSHGWNL